MAPSCLEEAVRAHLATAIQSDDHTAEDILRCYQLQATLLFESERVKTALTTDPFEHLEDAQAAVARLKKLLRVTEYHSVTTLDGYSRIEAAVRFSADKAMQPTVGSHVELRFRYERQATSPATVSFSIDLAKDFGVAERMLWVNVQAVGTVPSSNKARNMADDDEDEDLWSDMEEDAAADDNDDSRQVDQSTQNAKKAKSEIKTSVETTATDDEAQKEEEDASCDRFVAGIDPDLLELFLQWTRIGPMDDITVFFLLMTFPFYEHEWDLVGYLLVSVFGSDDNSGDEGGDD